MLNGTSHGKKKRLENQRWVNLAFYQKVKKDQMVTHMARRKGWKIGDGKSYQISKRTQKNRWQLTWQEENAGKLL